MITPQRRRRAPALFAALTALVVVAAACSGEAPDGAGAHGLPGHGALHSGPGPHDGFRLDGGPSGEGRGAVAGTDSGSRGSSPGTTSFEQGERAQSVKEYVRSLTQRGGLPEAATSDGPAQQFGQFLSDVQLWGTASVNQVGDSYEVCTTQVLPSCLSISSFTYGTNGWIQSFKLDGTPVDSLVHYQSGASMQQGKLASVGFQGALAIPKDHRLIVILSYGWESEVDTTTTGCDPSKATYTVNGAELPRAGFSGGGGPGEGGSTSFFDMLVMVTSFPTASLGGTVNVSCYASTGASERFHISLPG